MARHRRFSLEFKRQVVLDFLERRMGLRELARKHNLSRNLLSQWVRKYETGQLTDEVVTTVRIAEYEGKIAELERKVGQLTMFQPLPQRAGTCGLRRRARFSGRRGARLVRSLCSALYSFRQLPRPKPDWPERSFVLTPDAQMEIDLETAETAHRLGLDGIHRRRTNARSSRISPLTILPARTPWASAWEERLAVAGIELFLEVDSVKIFGEPFRTGLGGQRPTAW